MSHPGINPARPSRSSHWWPCLLAGIAAALCEGVHSGTRDGLLPWGYLGVCAGLVIAASAALGIFAQLARVPAHLALVAWAAAAGAWLHGWLALAVFASAALGAAAVARRSPPPVVVSAAVTGLLFAVTWIHSGWLTPVIAAGKLTGEQAQLARHGVTFLVVALACAWLGGRSWVRTAPLRAVLVATALAVGASISPRFWRGPETVVPAPPAATVAASAPGENLLLIVLDTVRADHTSVYGYARRTTPQLEHLLATRPGAVRYPDAYANGSWTLPAHASLLTGQIPSVHGAEHSGDLEEFTHAAGIFPEVRSLVEGMGARGRATLAVFANPWLRQGRGISRGFASFDFLPPPKVPRTVGERMRRALVPGLRAVDVKPYCGADRVSERLLVRLAAVGDRPFFALANYMDAHPPNVAPAGVAGTFGPYSIFDPHHHVLLKNDADVNRRLMDRYDEQILELDRRIGELFEELERMGLLDTTWAIVVADHGEAFGEHGATSHGTTLFEEQVRVPLLIFPPRGAALAPASGPVSQVDVAATMAAIAGVEYSGPGRDLRQAGAPSLVQMQRGAAPFRVPRHGELARRAARAVVRWPWKLLEIQGELRLFDLSADPSEATNLAAARPEMVRELEPLLPEPMARNAVFEPDASPQSEENAEALKQLGY